MARNQNTDKNGNSWSDSTKLAVWKKGTSIDGYDSNVWRRDKCGRAMKYADHGDRQSEYSWEIDHINPVSNGGDDSIGNLQPLYWANNVDKSDKLSWTCPR